MKIFSAGKPVSPATARNCFLLNQFATPGLGSLMGRRILPGIGQVILAVTGAALELVWFSMTMIQYYNMIESDAPIKSYARFAQAGALVFATAWVWALFTSTSILRQAKTRETTDPHHATPPFSGPTPG
jgi:hypothetical protein